MLRIISLMALCAASVLAQCSATATNSAASGNITFGVSLTGCTTLDSVEYQLDRKPLPGTTSINIATVSPWSIVWSSGWSRDGVHRVRAVLRDPARAILATTSEVSFTLDNHASHIVSISSPTQGATVSGSISLTADSTPSTSIILYYTVDGKMITQHFGTAPNTVSFDTTTLADGDHEFTTSLRLQSALNGVPNPVRGQTTNWFTTNNGTAARELRTNFREVYLTPAETVTLTATVLRCNGTTAAGTLSFSSGAAGVATVNSTSGLVTGVAAGNTTITITDSVTSKVATVRVFVDATHVFPHWGKTGVRTSYSAVDSVFPSAMYQFGYGLLNTASIRTLLGEHGFTAVEAGVYTNPIDTANPTNSTNYNSQVGGIRSAIDSAFAAGSAGYLRWGVGDDFQRTDAEMDCSISNSNCPFGATAMTGALQWAAATNMMPFIEMNDEVDALWGSTPSPSDSRWVPRTPSIPDSAFTTLLSRINAASSRPPIAYQVSGPAAAGTMQAWTSASTLMEFYPIYYDLITYNKAYYDRASITQFKDTMDSAWTSRLPYMSRTKPVHWLAHAIGPRYNKQVAGADFVPASDELVEAPHADARGVSAQIMYAATYGSAVHLYKYDSADDIAYRTGVGIGNEAQTGWTFSDNNKSIGRASGLTLRLVNRLKPYLLQPQMHAPDLGFLITTGARTGAFGKLVLVTNFSEVPQSITVPFAAYQTGGVRTTRWRLSYPSLTTTTIAAATTSETLTLAAGETAVWLFPATDADVAGLSILAFKPDAVTNGASVAVQYSYVSSDLAPMQSSALTCAAACSTTIDTLIGPVSYQYQYLSSAGAVVAKSNVHSLTF